MGEVLERRARAGRLVYVLRVEQAYNAELSGRVEVVTAGDGAQCGLALAVGERVGLLLDRAGGEWRSGLCQQVDPAAFLAPAEIDDNALPPINVGGYVVGFLVLALGVLLLVRRRRQITATRHESVDEASRETR